MSAAGGGCCSPVTCPDAIYALRLTDKAAGVEVPGERIAQTFHPLTHNGVVGAIL